MKENEALIDYEPHQLVLYVEKADGTFGPLQTGSFISKNYIEDFWDKMEKLRRVLELRLEQSLTWRKVELDREGDELVIKWSEPRKPPFLFHHKSICVSEIDRVLRQQVNKLNNERNVHGRPDFCKLV